MTDRAGVLRSGTGLAIAAEELGKLGEHQSRDPSLAAWEATNLHLLASALVASATYRTETRGSHWREDYPDASDTWLGHLIVTLDAATAGKPSPAGKPRTDTQSRPLQNAPAGTGVHPDLDADDGLVVRFAPAQQHAEDIQPSSPTQRAFDSDIHPQPGGAAAPYHDSQERSDG